MNREEIRDGVFYVLQDVRLGALSEYEATLKLQELGCVIKVDKDPFDRLLTEKEADLYLEILKAGYVAVEPLVEE